jgi:hypothetical protein
MGVSLSQVTALLSLHSCPGLSFYPSFRLSSSFPTMASHPSLPQLPQLPPLDLHDAAGGAHGPFADPFSMPFPPNSPRPSLSPPPLRKSISVDSFATTPGFTSPHKQPEPQPSSSRGFVAGLTSAFRRDSVADLRSSRNRGASVSSVRDQHHPRDSDLDRQPFPDRDQRFRLPSLKGAEPPRLAVRGGELPLPARTAPSTSESSAPAPLSSSSEQPPYGSPQPAVPRRSVASAINSGRARSMSNGAQSQPQPKKIVINTQLCIVRPCSFLNVVRFN